MINYFKKRTNKTANIVAIVCLIVAVIACAVSFSGVKGLIFGPKKIDAGADLEDYEGEYVRMEVTNVMAEYVRLSTKYTNKNGTNRTELNHIGYLCVWNNDDYETWATEKYYGIILKASEEKTMDARMDDFYDFLSGDKMEAPSKFTVTGTICEIEDQHLKYYKGTMNDIDEAIAEQGGDGWGFVNVQNYTIDTRYIGDSKNSQTYLSLAVAIVAILIGVLYYIFAMLGFDNAYKKFLKKHPEIHPELLDMEFQKAKRIHKDLFLSENYIFYRSGTKVHVMCLSEIVWAYYFRLTGRNSASETRFYDINKKMEAILTSQEQSHEILEMLNQYRQNIVVGYSDDLDRLYKSDFQQFLSLRYNPSKNEEN